MLEEKQEDSQHQQHAALEQAEVIEYDLGKAGVRVSIIISAWVRLTNFGHLC